VEIATFGAGCFWKVEDAFRKGLTPPHDIGGRGLQGSEFDSEHSPLACMPRQLKGVKSTSVRLAI
jgi:hypothetical protein